ncbi:MAG: HesA/MoeB/ThiF family protein [Candidatus Bathyarchaeota archaeon]|nr:MAG: HesA/MoeB/ThiF family protein [Candidatus Bathyarchaeota archaeon]
MARIDVQDFSEEELEYYSRQIVLQEIGLAGQKRLNEAKVCVVGLGGLGSPISIQLASMGVGHLRIVDRDVVETSNLQRQHLYGMDVIGYPKVEAAANRLRKLNPHIEVEPVPLSLSPKNVERIIGGVDVVVDGLDMMTPRYLLNRACVKLGVPFVFGAVITHIGNVSTIIPGETACLECFQGDVDDDELPTCAIVGVHPSIISVIASIQVSETVRLITGKTPNLANTLLYCDLGDLSFERIKLAKAESCPVCGSAPRSKPSPIEHQPVQEICGREGRRVFVFSPDDELDMDLTALNSRLEKLGYELLVKARLGSTFVKDPVKGSVLKSGVTILEGVDAKEKAQEIYEQLFEP